MTEKNSENNINKTPSKMSRLAWPKAKYGVILAIIIMKRPIFTRADKGAKMFFVNFFH